MQAAVVRPPSRSGTSSWSFYQAASESDNARSARSGPGSQSPDPGHARKTRAGSTDRPNSWRWQRKHAIGTERIGDILVGSGAISGEDRDRILAYQELQKVSFGTALLEMGVLSEELFLRALFIQQAAPPASVKDFDSIPPEVIQLVPRDLVMRFTAIPFRKVGRVLHLAMAQPKDNPGIGEIAAITGLTVVAFVGIAGRIIVAAEKYYGIPATPRLKKLVEALDKTTATRKATNLRLVASPPAISRPQPSSSDPIPSEAPSLERQEAVDPWGSGDEHIRNAFVNNVFVETYGPDFEDQPEAGAADRSHECGSTPEPVIETVPANMPSSRDGLVAECFEAEPKLPLDVLCAAEGGEEIVATVLGLLKGRLSSVALLTVRGEQVNGWRSTPTLSPVREFTMPSPEPSLIASLRGGAAYCVGPCPDTPGDQRLLESIGASFPGNVVCVPINQSNNATLLLLGQPFPGTEVEALVPQMERAAALAAASLKILALKRRMRGLWEEELLDRP